MLNVSPCREDKYHVLVLLVAKKWSKSEFPSRMCMPCEYFTVCSFTLKMTNCPSNCSFAYRLTQSIQNKWPSVHCMICSAVNGWSTKQHWQVALLFACWAVDVNALIDRQKSNSVVFVKVVYFLIDTFTFFTPWYSHALCFFCCVYSVTLESWHCNLFYRSGFQWLF